MNLKPVLEIIEALVVEQIELKQDALVDNVLAKLAALIPGKLDDMLLAQVAPLIKEELKAEALKLADKIDGEVG